MKLRPSEEIEAVFVTDSYRHWPVRFKGMSELEERIVSFKRSKSAKFFLGVYWRRVPAYSFAR